MKRYRIVFRDLLKRESLAVLWRDVPMIDDWSCAAKFVADALFSGFIGEQFGLPKAVEALRAVRKDPEAGSQERRLSGLDPLNLVGIILPDDRIPAHPSQHVVCQNETAHPLHQNPSPQPPRQPSVG